MSEQEQISQLSALFDGELPSQQADLVTRRALKDPAMRQRWQRYAMIGACVRGEPLAGADGQACLADRVSERIATEVEILAPWGTRAAAGSAAGRSVGRFFGRGAMGGALAAAVAVMAVFGIRSIGPAVDQPAAGEVYAQGYADRDATPQMVADESAPHSYTTPGENAGVSAPLTDQQPLAHYVVAHSEQAASALGFSYDLTEGAVVMTADEIQAHLR
jgi:negative regulator of sigma E activity